MFTDLSRRYSTVVRQRRTPSFRVYNDFQAIKIVRLGPWYGDKGSSSGCYSLLGLDVPESEVSVLSKSSYKLALVCPRKLVYRRERYPSSAEKDPYLDFLADGGFLVEAVARALFPDGQIIAPQEGETTAQATARLLRSENVDLFEAVFEHGGLSARVDVLSKRGGVIELIEVKAKSVNMERADGSPLRGTRGGISAEWRPYLEDVAFQVHVVRSVMGPSCTVRPKLCVVDVSKACGEAATFSALDLTPRDERAFGMPTAHYVGDVAALRQNHFLAFLDVSAEVEELLSGPDSCAAVAPSIALAILQGDRSCLKPAIGTHCRDCEYRVDGTDESGRNGFRECWGGLAAGSPHVLDLYRIDKLGGRGEGGLLWLLERGISAISDIPDRMFADGEIGQRQRRQVQATRSGRDWIGPGMGPALAAACAPFHFVDFETSRMPVPYHAGMRPYGQVAFQFSCHTVSGDGALSHREWINVDDRYPNIEFAMALRDVIGDAGTMLVWSAHERTALREIREQLLREGGGPAGLVDWLEPPTLDVEKGGRTLDLYNICRRHYVHPAMGGKTSIKAVLQAVWKGNPSLHVHPWFAAYVRREGDSVRSPYEVLADVVTDAGIVAAVREGTGAMRAYQDMLYGRRRGDAAYKEACRRALLEYCKLDTLAMVIVWTHWMERTSGATSHVSA